MRLPGFCIRCHRIKQVRVTGHEIVKMQAMQRPPQGICADCERKENCQHVRVADLRDEFVRCLYCSETGRRVRGQIVWPRR